MMNYHLTSTMLQKVFLIGLLGFNSIVYTQVFQNISEIDLYGGYLGFATWCDYNSDGYLDIFVTGQDFGVTSQHALFYRNNGDDSFSESNITLIPKTIYGDFSWGDFDNNGTVDLVYAGTTSGFCEQNITKIYKNVNDAGFVEIFHDIPALSRCCFQWVDVNNDGLLDIYFHGINSSEEFNLGIFKNSGSDIFTEVETNIEKINGPRGNLTQNSVKWIDFDKDGFKDVIIAMSSNDDYKVACYKNLGGFHFLNIETVLPDLNYVKMAAGDINQDGLIDIAISGSFEQTLSSGDVHANLYIFINMGGMVFEELTRITNIGVFFNSLELGDIDNDGYLDILYYGAGGSSRDFKLFKNNQGISFSPVSDNFPASGLGGASFGDFDNDNDLDILYYGRMYSLPYEPEMTRIYKNIMAVANSKPEPPDNLSVFAIENDLMISWDNGSDDATLPQSLYANLCIGTSLNASALLSSYSLNGKLKVINLGNQNLNRQYLFREFPEEAVEIKVQTIDNSYNASVFSDTIEFCFRKTSHLFNDTLFFCSGDSAFIGLSEYYPHYLWNTGGQDSFIYVTSEGLYNVNLTHPDGCISSETVYVKENDAPFVDLGEDVTITHSQTCTLSANIENSIFLWSNGSNKQSITIQGKDEPTGDHLYWLNVIDESGCTGIDSIVVHIVDAIWPVDNWDVIVYPVPYFNQFTIESNCIMPLETALEIFDITGKKVYKNTLNGLDYKHSISLSEISDGIYYLSITVKKVNLHKMFKLVKLQPRYE